MPKEESNQGFKQRASLLVQSGKVAADTAKGSSAIFTAEGARNLLLNFDHAKIPLGLIVGKRDGEVIQESQHLMSPMQQRIQQILGFRLSLWAPLASRSGLGRRLSSICDGQDAEIASYPSITNLLWDTAGSKISPVPRHAIHRNQDPVHRPCPLLFELLKDPRQISQEMGSTNALFTVIVVITTESVSHEASLIERQNPDLVHSHFPSALMPLQLGEKGRTVDMEPMRFLAIPLMLVVPKWSGSLPRSSIPKAAS